MLAVFVGIQLIKWNDSEPDDDYTACEKMVLSYIGEPKADHHSSPLQYWKNKLQYPLLVQLARKYLTLLCTTVPSERLFSTAGNIVTDKRTRLDIDKVEMLLF